MGQNTQMKAAPVARQYVFGRAAGYSHSLMLVSGAGTTPAMHCTPGQVAASGMTLVPRSLPPRAQACRTIERKNLLNFLSRRWFPR